MEKQELITALFKAMNTRDFSTVEKQVTEDVAFDFPGAGRIEGAKRVFIFLKALLRKYKTLVFTVHDVLIDYNAACAVWTNKGEHSEGHPYNNSGVTLFHFTDNKISFLSDYFKDTSFVK
ncbi:MAG: nuclear transport factor 2 family protein [Bacteroidales bacterium]|nr:nuclear transport factor 2 family protein [Bacteroidales bacterium]